MLQQKKPTYAYVLGYVTYLCNKKCISVGFIVAEINIFQKAVLKTRPFDFLPALRCTIVRWKYFKLYLGTSSIIDDLCGNEVMLELVKIIMCGSHKFRYLVVHSYVRCIYHTYGIGGM